MNLGPPFLVLLFTAVPLTANITSVKTASPAPSKRTAAMDAAKFKTPSKTMLTTSRSLPASRMAVKSAPVPTRSAAKALPVSTLPVSTLPVPKAVPVVAGNTKTVATAPSKSGSTKKSATRFTSTKKTKAKPIPVIIPNRSEYIDISFPEPPGGKASSKEKPAEPARKVAPVEEISGWSLTARAGETPEAVAAAGRR